MESSKSFTSKDENYSVSFTDDHKIAGEFEYLNLNEVDGPMGELENSIELARLVLAVPNTYYCVVRDSKGVPVSGGGLLLLDNVNNGLVGQMQAFYTLPEARRRGLSKKVIETILEKARGLGVQRLTLNCHVDNSKALGLYDKLDFKVQSQFNFLPYQGKTSSKEIYLEFQDKYSKNIEKIIQESPYLQAYSQQKYKSGLRIVYSSESSFIQYIDGTEGTPQFDSSLPYTNILTTKQDSGMSERLQAFLEKIKQGETNQGGHQFFLGIIIEDGETGEEIVGYTFHVKLRHFANLVGYDILDNVSLKQDRLTHWAAYLLKSLDTYNIRLAGNRKTFGLGMIKEIEDEEREQELLIFLKEIALIDIYDYFLLMKEF